MSKTLTLLGVAALVAVVAYLMSSVGERQLDLPASDTALDEAAKNQLAAKASIAQIAAESEAIDAPATGEETPPVRAEAPPGFVPAPVVHQATPPEGYSFASHHEVARGPMTEYDIDRAQAPADLPAWMAHGEANLGVQAAAAGRAWSFGWVRLSEGADLEELRELLAAHGGEALGQAGDLVRARLPGDPARLEAIARAGSVAGVGALPPEVKVADGLAELQTNGSDLPVWITLMSDDPDGRWRRALQGLGAEVGRFDPALRSYAATIPAVALGPVSQADYVLAVESIGRVEPTLEIATTAMGADSVRSYDAGMETFVGTGGASVTVGVMDTGLNVDHPDISSNRRSICGANFAVSADGRADDQVLWFDRFLHGTHVTGILAGNGAVQRNRAGMAPLVQDIRVAKATNVAGRASALGWNRAMDWFATPTACGGDGVPRKALVINSSIGVTGDYWVGRSIGERKIDASVWAARQLFVTSTGNSATSASSSMAGAKNALTVGAASNTGDIAVFSSRGPTADGRLMPKIVGTGVAVLSPRGGGSTGRYFLASGTSMASPSVAGVAALVMDAIPELKEEPAAVRARLMASAIKPDAFLGDDAAFPLDNTNGPGTFNNAYGLGKVSARTAVLSRDDEDGWIGGSASFDIDEDSHAYHDIVVPEGASRLDIVMTWDEPPAEVITTPVLHDLDLWVDRGASCGNVAACGKYTSRSRVDNVEWVIVPNPPAGVYRLKVLPNRIYGPAPRAGLAWTVIRGDSSPSLGVAVDREVIEVAPDVPFEVDVTVSSDAYVAAGANLRVECRTAVGSTACDAFNLEGAQLPFSRDDSSLVREDALERSLARDVLIALGELGPDEQQNVSLKFAGQPEGSFRLHIAAASWNGAGGDASVAVIVGDSDQPAPVQRPPNDDFAMAIELDSEGGETTFDLMAATPDPGEPTLEIGGLPTRPRSLWYVWTAPETGLAQFAVARSTLDDYADLVVVDAFRDAPLAGLAAIGGTQLGGGKTFFAERGETYRIRLSVDTRLLFSTPPPQQRPQERRSLSFPELVLRWGPGSRPDNDDYAFAADLQGENGVVAGTGQGATTEPAEFMGHSNADYPEDTGGWLSSVWYRWTAPSTGDFVFYVNRASQAVAVFAGDSLSGARMVSGAPFFEVVFPATEGVEYRIGVANRDADWAGTDFELGWAPDERINPGNDDFAAAAQTFGDSAFTPVDFNTMTVEHGEPDASGVRTAWWVWQPSADGRYTWLAERLGGFQKDDAPLNRAAFAGDELHTLEAVAVRDGSEGFAEQLVFDARADTAYRFALGLPRDAAQTSLEPGYVSMRWGPTPENDDFANAVALTGMSGSVGGSNEFATNEKGERTGTLGDSSLWWTFQSDESGWVRFVVDGPPGSKLAIYRMNADADIELLRVSRDLGEVAATVHVEAGETYVLRLGSYYCDADGCGIGSRGSFEIAWRPSDPPALLRYVGRVVGEATPRGSWFIELATLGDQAFNGDGSELYVASDAGLVVFERDAETGDLTMLETVAPGLVDSYTDLIWDETGSALLAVSCSAWRKFSPAEGGGVKHVANVAGAPCPLGDVLVAGDLVHHVMAPWMIETLRFDEDRESLSAVGVNTIPDIAHAAITADGGNVYAITNDRGEYGLIAMERDGETGSLRITAIVEEGSPTGGAGEGLVEGLVDVAALTVHGSHLFVSAGARAATTLVFDLADRANPVFLGNWSLNQRNFGACDHRAARHDVAALDIACGFGEWFVVQAGADGSVFASDRMRSEFTDSFGNVLPQSGDVASFVASPDGRHVYMAGSFFYLEIDPQAGFIFGHRNQMLVFERVYGD